MASYSYTAIGKDGKTKKGSIEASTKEKAITSLKDSGEIPVSVKEQNLLTMDINISIGNPVKPRDISVFCKQFLSLLAAGVNIIDTLNMLGEQTDNKHMKKAIKEMQAEVEKGETLAGAMRLQKKVFPSILINMIEAGEASGSLEIAFDRMSTHFDKETKLKAMVKKAMMYPIIVAVIAVVIVIAMMLFVIPNFINMFGEMDIEMPLITRIVIGISDFITAYWYIVFGAVAVIVVILRTFASSEIGKNVLGRLQIKMPVFGSLTVKSSAARLGRTLSTLMAAGIPLIEAIDLTAKTMENITFKNALLLAKEDVAKGIPLSVPLRMSGIFPPLVVHMTKIGEETGNIEDMLNKVADYYEEEVEIATDALSAVLEPMLILVVALVVGTMVLAIMAPMLSMYEGLDSL